MENLKLRLLSHPDIANSGGIGAVIPKAYVQAGRKTHGRERLDATLHNVIRN